jgi:hypothetical protein
MEMSLDIEGVLIFLGGCVIAGFCALYWKRQRFLHLVPFGYSFLVDIIFRTNRGLPFEWQAPLFFGALFYIVGWIAAYTQLKNAG